MTTLNLPSPPGNLTNDLTTDVNRLGDWLLEVARQCGEPALDSALSAGWPARRSSGCPSSRTSWPPATKRGSWRARRGPKSARLPGRGASDGQEAAEDRAAEVA